MSVGFWSALSYMLWSVAIVGITQVTNIPIVGFVEFPGLLVNAIYPFWWILSNEKLTQFSKKVIGVK